MGHWNRRITFTLFVGALIAAPFWIPGPGEKPMVSIDDLLPDATTFTKLLNQGKRATKILGAYIPGDTPADKQATVHRWQDADGVWHFSDTEPADDTDITSTPIKIDTSRITPLGDMPEPIKKVTTEKPAENPDAPFIPSLSNPDDLIKKAQEARDQMNERHSEQQKILDSL